MENILNVSGMEESCRQKASSHFLRIENSLEGLSDEDKFKGYLEAHKKVEWGVIRCRENFEGENHNRFAQDWQCAIQLNKAEREGVYLMELLCEAMKPLKNEHNEPLAYVNGTSEAFSVCFKRCTEERDNLADSDKVLHEKILLKTSTPQMDGLLKQLAAKMPQVVVALLVLPDMITV